MISQSSILMMVVCVIILAAIRLRFAKRESAQTKGSRLGRIAKASFVVQCLLWILLPLGIYSLVAFIFDWPQLPSDLKIIVAPGHVYDKAIEVPPQVLPLWVVQSLLNLWGGVMFLRLFWLFGRGILFSAKNVICIRFFGWLLIINWFIDMQIHSQFRDYGVSTTPLFIGLLIIFAAWIMDEGRKIQEEQELTV